MSNLGVGAQFAGRFRIDGTLGHGGFATVYRALDTTNGEPVALKILTPDRAGNYDPDMRARFLREVRIVASLRDRHTVQLIDSGDTDGRLWAAFEEVPGRDLAELLKDDARLDADSTIQILRQVLASLAEAHAQGLVHRDLKPENIRVFDGAEGPLTVKVLDFGIARSTDAGHPSVTSTGELIGTPRYMSPEQLRGLPLSPASDIYTLGLIAFELLAGRAALQGNSLTDQVDRMLPGHQFSLASTDPATQALMTVIHRMVTPDLSLRVGTAHAVLRLLQPPERRSAHPKAEAAQRGWLTTPLVGGLVLLSLVGAALFWAYPDEERPPPPPPPPPKLVNPLVVAPPAAPKPPTGPDASVDPVAEPGCPTMERGLGEKRYRDGTTLHSVFTYVPDTFDVSADPAVLLLLSEGSPRVTPETFFEYARLREWADRKNIIVIVPKSKPPNASKILGPSSWGPEALSIAIDQLDTVRSAACVEDAPVLLIGEGAGAGAVDVLADRFPEMFAAAVVSGHRYKKVEPQTAGGKVPYLYLTQILDHWAPVSGGPSCPDEQPPDSPRPDVDDKDIAVPLAQQEEALRTAHGCDKAERIETGGETCQIWDCETLLQTCHIDAGRDWTPKPPWRDQKESECVGSSADVDYETLIWDFFERARKP